MLEKEFMDADMIIKMENRRKREEYNRYRIERDLINRKLHGSKKARKTFSKAVSFRRYLEMVPNLTDEEIAIINKTCNASFAKLIEELKKEMPSFKLSEKGFRTLRDYIN